MNNTAIVNRIENNSIFLMHIKDYGNKEKTERSFWNIKDLEFESENPKCFNIKEGDAVEYYIPEGKTIIASFTVLILPIIVFILSYIILQTAGLKSEKLTALISVTLMVLSFSITKIFKIIGYKETHPIITKVLSKENLNSLKLKCSDCGSCTACN